MAAGVLLKLARELGIKVSLRTAGLAHHPNSRVAVQAVEVMREIGIDISHEYSKPLQDADLKWADIVIGLQKDHLGYLSEDYPSLARKFRYLGRDIEDPYLRSLQIYRAT